MTARTPPIRHAGPALAAPSLAALCLVLAACSAEKPAPDPMAEQDPVATAALNDQIMVDPDLANQNEANAALTGGSDASVPPPNATPEAIAAARDDAAELVGGMSRMVAPPEAKPSAGSAASPILTAAARAAVSPGGADCASQVTYSAVWAAKLPAALPVYPRGATQEAAGTDKGACALRVVTFQTPVSVDDVLAFYNTRATQAGYSVEHLLDKGEHVLGGSKDRATYVVYVRALDNGISEVDLVTSGK